MTEIRIFSKGTTSFGGATSDVLLQTNLKVNKNGICTDPFGLAPLVWHQFCAGVLGSRPHDSCQGDSGGPLGVRDVSGKFWLAGVVRWEN